MKQDIQIDMFEVQLGAAILLQFRDSNGAVRVLADAGIHASGYTDEHVHQKLDEIFAEQDGEERRIDLMIGTHYDADHLEGLVPILEDETIEVGQLWLPPVANDVEEASFDTAVGDHQLLAVQFAGENHRESLERYIAEKQNQIGELVEIAGQPDWETSRHWNERSDFERRGPGEFQRTSDEKYLGERLADQLSQLRSQLSALRGTLGDDEPHGGTPITDVVEEIIERPTQIFGPSGFPLGRLEMVDPAERIALARSRLENAPALASTQRRTLMHIRKAAVKDAINATSLYKVVQAAQARGITAQTEIIDDGAPRRFVWKRDKQKFVGARGAVSGSPVLTLLGPSASLVKKHRDRLPRGTYLWMALAARTEIKSITPSNQLSYVARLEHKGQGLLISGDAGFVDFKTGQEPYHPALLESLMPLHVVQVAHHGGANAHFYRVLSAAGMAAQKEHSYFLLSHATDDKYRPSREFRVFVEELRTDADDFSVLFTAQPKSEKVADFRDVVAPASAGPDDRGDVRLVFAKGVWTIEKHFIAV